LLRLRENVVYFMPPYGITSEESDQLARVARAGIDSATAD
jgi:adenosylmethionine-8-amino-7-oxononanoate aminotransferase